MSRRRRWPAIVGGVVALVLLALATVPWWLGGALTAVAPRFGLRYAEYQRIGYSRFALRGVELTRGVVTLRADRIEADTPLLWAWRHARHQVTAVTAGDWSVDVAKSTTPRSPQPTGWMPLRGKLRRIAATLERWLPEARLGSGRVRWPTGALAIGGAQWRQRTLTVVKLQWRQISADGTVRFPADRDEVLLSATDAAAGAAAALQSTGDTVAGSISWWNQPAHVTATFAGQGWLPPAAAIDAPQLALPAERLKLATFYRSVSGRAHAEWRTDHFLADVALHGTPLPGKSAPPLDVTLRGRGDAHAFTVEALHAQLPGGVAELSAPVTVERNGRLRESAAQFSVQLDLARQPWLHASGRIEGRARVSTAAGRIPGVAFEAAAADVVLGDTAIKRTTVTGRLDWPELRIEQAVVTGAAGEELHGSGGWNFHTRQVLEARVAGDVVPATIRRWLPPTVRFSRLALDASLSGPIMEMSHRGWCEVRGLQLPHLKPADAKVTWRGRGSQVEAFSVDATAGVLAVTASGSAGASSVTLRQLAVTERGAEQLRLTEPARIAWRPTLAIENLHLAGPGVAIDGAVSWGATGHVAIVVHGFQSRWLGEFLPLRGPQWTVDSLALNGSWDRGPMTYTTAGGLTFPLPNGRVAAVNFSARGDAASMQIQALHAVETGRPVVNAAGRLPLSLVPGRPGLVVLHPGGALGFDATTVPNAPFWQQLALMTGVELRAPELNAHLGGTWAQPQGRITLRAEHAAMDPKRFARPLPSVGAVDVAVTADAAGLRLDRFSFTVEGQLVRATGRLPLPARMWSALRRDPLAYLERGGQLRVEVPDAQVAMFSRFLPAALAPAGRFQADVRFDHGTLGGYLRLHDAASRPLGPLGVLQQVNAEVTFSDHQVNLRQVTATSGGQPVTLTGSVELGAGSWANGGAVQPRYHIVLQGKNLPFVRQAGLLVRGDLDLKLESPRSGPPAISGRVVLRDSLFLTDVRAYLPHGATASPARRPPYFAVDTPPLNTWTLDVDVSGTRFMRIRMPVFIGVASAHFHLGGTLGAPRAIGEAVIDQGQVLMPFASFTVKQGAVRLTEEDPSEPTIYLRGTGTHFGYDLAMEVTGKASAPKITFTSTPALDSDQVLLMVMTGAAPSNEVSTSLTHRAVQLGAFFGQSLFGSLMGSGADPSRLSVESGDKISEQGKETYSIEYRLTNRWSLTGEYDEFDEYNVGVKWRVAPKKLDQ